MNSIRLHHNIKLTVERKVLKRKSGHLRGTMGSGSLAGATSRVEESMDIDENPPQVEEAKYAIKIMKSKKLDIALANDSVTASSIKKLLLLGAGGSGKSTIFKQFRSEMARRGGKRKPCAKALISADPSVFSW